MIDRDSETWSDVLESSRKRIAADVEVLKSRGLSQQDSEFHRGRIEALEETIRLDPRERPELTPLK